MKHVLKVIALTLILTACGTDDIAETNAIILSQPGTLTIPLPVNDDCTSQELLDEEGTLIFSPECQ